MPSAQNLRAANDAANPNDLDAFWLPFTPNRAFKKQPAADRRAPRTCTTTRRTAARSSTARPACGAATPATTATPIVAAIQQQAAELDYRAGLPVRPSARRSSSRRAHRRARAGRPRPRVLLQLRLGGGRHRAQDRARLSQRAAAQGTRTRLIGRERGYHGVGFGGISVGGIVNNRKCFGTLLAGVDHLPHTYNREQQAFTKGEPEWGAHLADELERIVALHDASTIAAVIVEPMAGSTGVPAAAQGLPAAAARRSATSTASC